MTQPRISPANWPTLSFLIVLAPALFPSPCGGQEKPEATPRTSANGLSRPDAAAPVSSKGPVPSKDPVVSGPNDPKVPRAGEAALLPPLPEGVVHVKFGEFFKPIGRRGLEFSDRLRSLHGRRVRILGFMVQQGEPLPGRFLIAPVPVKLHEHEYGLCEDLPPATVHVSMPVAERAKLVPFTPGFLLITGVLEIGNREEPDGRISTVRLVLDPKSAAAEGPPPAAKPVDHPSTETPSTQRKEEK